MTDRFRASGVALTVGLLACGGKAPTRNPDPEVAAVVEMPTAAPEALNDARVIELGRGYVELLHARDHDGLWRHLAPEAKSRFGTVVEFRSQIDRIFDELGTEQRIVREGVELPGAGMLADRVYLRLAQYAGPGDTPVRLLIGLRNDGSIVGMQIRPAE